MVQQVMSEYIDYLVIGHLSQDKVAKGVRVGGTVAYAARTAQALHCHTAVVTAASAEYDLGLALPGITVQCVPSAHSTCFTNTYTANGRIQTLHSLATPLTAAHIPTAWQRAAVVHLGPIANEVDAQMIDLFSNSMVGLTPQGWMRRWDENGRVYAREWEAAATILPLAAAVILSEEDLLHLDMLAQYRQWAPLLVLTRGYNGCTVFFNGTERHFPAPAVVEKEMTGAGDIFATAYLIRLWQTDGNPWEAARFANEVASQSVTQPDIDSKMAHLLHHFSL